MAQYKELIEFVDNAVRNRKYSSGAAEGLRAALRLFESELNTEEKGSITKFEENIDAIYANVVSKNKSRLSIESLNTYKARVQRVLTHYRSYGVDPTKMSQWNPQRRVMSQVKRESKSTTEAKAKQGSDNEIMLPPVDNSHKIELSLRPDAKCVLIVPRDLRTAEANIIKGLVDSLVAKEVHE